MLITLDAIYNSVAPVSGSRSELSVQVYPTPTAQQTRTARNLSTAPAVRPDTHFVVSVIVCEGPSWLCWVEQQ